jgi:cold-inducible RNA-binding protein
MNMAQTGNRPSTKGKIYIGNLHYSIETEQLIEKFSSYGEIVDAVVIKDKETGASRGFGFVTYSEPSAARTAMEMHGETLEGRPLRVKMAEAKPRQHHLAFMPNQFSHETEDVY